MRPKSSALRKYVQYNALVAWRTRDFWVRAIMCWLIGAVLLVNDEASNFDMRLKVRGPRPSAAPIVLIDLTERDWANLDPESRNILRPLKEIVTLSDAYFWNPRVWERLMGRVLADQPTAVGVTLFFGENVRSSHVSDTARALFEDPRVVWGADVDSYSGRILMPQFGQGGRQNIGLRGLRHDEDGTVRRFSTSVTNLSGVPASLASGIPEIGQVPHLAVKLALRARPELATWVSAHYGKPELINYIGDAASFPVVNAKDIIEGRVAPGLFKDRIVIIGSLSSVIDEMQTPLGRMSRTEVIANLTDNVLGKRMITRLPTPIYLFGLAFFMAAAIWVLTNYPQSVALVAYGLSAIIWMALSVWFFDGWCFWIPVLSPLVQLTVTCIVYLSYQLALNERRTWRLEQEQRYLSEIEQLKSNFVSMMSHDLKTPIAKIQAICDRLIATAEPGHAIAHDLRSLRRSSDELHRYIQSILQVTKVEAKDFRIQKEVTDINENIERVVARLQPLAKEKGLRIVTSLEPMFSIEADQNLIQEVIHNLIENAIKYTPGLGPSAEPNPQSRPAAQVRVVSQERDDKVWVVVEDTGPGIDPSEQKEVWKKFTRGRNQISAGLELRGTGLGLYLVKYFVELHGGQVTLESELGHGTKIGFSIPIAESETEAGPQSASGEMLVPAANEETKIGESKKDEPSARQT